MICITCGEDCSDMRGALEHKILYGHNNYLTMPTFAVGSAGPQKGERVIEFLRRVYLSTQTVTYPPASRGRRTA